MSLEPGAAMNVDPLLNIAKSDTGAALIAAVGAGPPVVPTADSKPAKRVARRPQFIDVFQQLINGLPEQIALTDKDWNILAVNEAWTVTAALYGYTTLQPGTNYLEFCRDRADAGHRAAGPAVEGIERINSGAISAFRYMYDGNDRWEGYTFQLCINRMEIGGRTFATITRYDVSELVRLRRQCEKAGICLIEGQAEERRRIAREIHDSTLQLLTSLGLAVGQLKRTQGTAETVNVVADMEQLLSETQREIRAISFLAHPPLLEELGLAAALENLVNGLERRTGLKISLHIDEHYRLDHEDAEIVLYRVAQAALSNVHRHAHATNVTVSLIARRSMVHIAVSDDGAGMPVHVTRGVGLSGMRERVTELGGRLTVLRASPGTKLIATLPSRSRIRAVGDLAHGSQDWPQFPAADADILVSSAVAETMDSSVRGERQGRIGQGSFAS
ncbi:MAG TPA: sensor histidine kinase [Nitrospiraceae bacterium]|nr:sensor histidine kinase [Nitrospiraceae bacterium]